MKKIIFLIGLLSSYNINANESIIYKDLLINNIDFSNSQFEKTIGRNYKKFFNKFVLNKEIKEQLIENDSLSDVLNICYNMSLGLKKEVFFNDEKEGEYCLKSYAFSGSKEALLYLSTYNYDLYKKVIIEQNFNNKDLLFKSVFYSGLAENNFYYNNSGLLKTEFVTYDYILSDKVNNINSKEEIETFFNSSLLFDYELPVNDLINNLNEDHYKEINNKFEKEIGEDKIFKDIKKNNFSSFIKALEENNPEEDFSDLDIKDYENFKDICSKNLLNQSELSLPKFYAEFCLGNIALNKKDKEAAYDLGLYYYAIGKSLKKNNPKLFFKYYENSIIWIALSYELGNSNSMPLFKSLLSSLNEDKDFFKKSIFLFKKERVYSKNLILGKIKN